MTPLTDEQKREVVLIASVGCDRETAARYAGCTLEQLVRASQADDNFSGQLHRAEAGCELAHMRSIQQAARDERHWRASVWWLERRLPERYARRDVGSISRRELKRFLEEVAEGVASAVRDESDRQRVLDTLSLLGESVSDSLLLEPDRGRAQEGGIPPGAV